MNKRGISLIVLVISIIVVIILSASVIITLNKNNPINGAKEAKFKQDISSFHDELSLTHSNNYLKQEGYEISKQNATGYDAIKVYIPDITKEYAKKLEIKNGGLVYIGSDENEKKWIKDLGFDGSELAWDVVLADAKSNPDKYKYTGQTSTNIGIGTDKIAANMDLWEFEPETDGNFKLKKYKGAIVSGKIVGTVPQYIYDTTSKDFKPVVSLDYTFSYNADIVTAPEIPSTITSMYNGAFYGCSNLVSITIPGTVKKIYGAAFGECTNLSYINLPEGIEQIYNKAFGGCTKLESIVIPASVTNIGDEPFYGCTKLKNVTLLDGITNISDKAFVGCKFTSITLPDSVTRIGSNAFESCLLESISIPNSVTTIGDRAFAGCLNLSGNVIIPENTTLIGGSHFLGTSIESVTTKTLSDGIFSGCKKLSNVTLLAGVTNINIGAFYGCTSLTSVKLPDSITKISAPAFVNCTGLTNITIPSSVTTMELNIFVGCTNLTSINIKKPASSITGAPWGAPSATVTWDYTGT